MTRNIAAQSLAFGGNQTILVMIEPGGRWLADLKATAGIANHKAIISPSHWAEECVFLLSTTMRLTRASTTYLLRPEAQSVKRIFGK